MSNEPIAIIGMACRFPGGANTPEDFWGLLKQGEVVISEVPIQRWDIDAYFDADPTASGKMYTRYGSFVIDMDQFDASFFGISPREAKRMDPQQRLLLEVAWEALEQSGHAAETLAGSQAGVFIGMMNTQEYTQLQVKHDTSYADDPYFGIGASASITAGRLSYLLDLHGPTMTIDTACSSSLVATHLACQSLHMHECNVALVGGTNAILLPESMVNACKMGMLAPDGVCKTFDAAADGFVLGEGCGVVVLKRLSEALADQDTIFAIIRGSAVNQDGRSNGITAPNKQAQAAVIRQALANAGVAPERVSYVEAHGSGTSLGDPIEIEALMQVLGEDRSEEQPLLVGAVKTNIGHLAGAAGIAGLIKTVLALRHQQIPPHVNVKERNPHIAWKKLPVELPARLTPWPAEKQPHIAGVSSFGWSGTNAHVILEEAIPVEQSGQSRADQIVLLSAKTETALDQATKNLVQYLKQHRTESLADIAYTSQVGRNAFAQRKVLVCREREEAIRALETGDHGHVLTGVHGGVHGGVHDGVPRPVAFLFPGLGEQYIGMAHDLYQQEVTFREIVDACCTLLKDQHELDLRELLLPPLRAAGENKSFSNGHGQQQKLDLPALLGRNGQNGQNGNSSFMAAAQLKQTALAQPAVFVIEYALAQQLMQWGIRPQAMFGYSLGEYVAACIAGVLSLKDALTLVAGRAKLIAEQPPGSMLTVMLSEEAALPYLNSQICLAAINGPDTCVLAGPTSAIEQLEGQLLLQGIAHRHVETTHAFHSTMLEPLCTAVTDLVGSVTLKPPAIPYISNVTGTWITAEQATDPTYWARHMCQTVRFAEGIECLLQEKGMLLLEVGPGQSLGSFVKQHSTCKRERMQTILSTLPSAHERHADTTFLLTTLGKLWIQGVAVDWNAFNADEPRQRLPLPTYPFERQRYWIEPKTQENGTRATTRVPTPAPTGRGKRSDHVDWFYQPTWEVSPLTVPGRESIERVPARGTTPPPAASEASGQDASPWLIFEDTTGLAEQIVQRLMQQGQQVVRVLLGEAFTRLDEYTFRIRPQQQADYEALCKVLHAQGQMPRTVLHCWSVSSQDETLADPNIFRAQQEQGFYSLISLTQAVAAQHYDEPMQIVAVSTHMQNVTGQEPLQPEKATILGACKVISQEHTTILCRSIDLAMPAGGIWTETACADWIIAECTTSTPDLVVAYRDEKRWVQTYQHTRLEMATDAAMPYRQGGVYLITGGLGGIGLVLAEHLAKTVQAKLVLLGRSALPAKESWAQWLESHDESTDGNTDANERTSRKIRQLQALEALGAEVLVCQADVADEAQMRRAIEQAITSFGALHGVFHAAGIINRDAFKTVQRTGREECELHFQPKVYGAYVLERVLQGHTLDFCLLFSSISAVLGGLGFAGYAAANIFLDAFAHKHNRNASMPWMSVNWDTWRIGSEHEQAMGGTMLENSMNAQEGLEALTRILFQRDRTHVINSTGDLHARMRQWIRQPAIVLSQHGTGEGTFSSAADTLAARPTGSRDYEHIISDIWQQALGLEQVGLSDNFFDLGGNSLIALEVIAKLKKAFHLQIPAVALFEAPTISTLATYLRPTLEPRPHAQQQVISQRRAKARQAIGHESVAIIGMAGRFPGAANIEQFWQNLDNGVESIAFFTSEELEEAGVDPVLIRRPNFVRARPILEQIDQFDAAFFGYSPREAELMDPQHRLFLECAWEAMEHAGYDALNYNGLVGVYAGANLSTYMLNFLTDPEAVGPVNDYQMVIGNDKDSLTTTVSYKLNLRGPSFAVQTFCSTSLVAAHLACQSLLNGECDMALAGGVSIRVPSKGGHLYEEGGMESPDGHCRTFDAQAKGSIFGDGVGIVVLKRLAEALEDGDSIHAVIKGSAINNDGSLKVSYTAPSVVGQSEVVTSALANAGVPADTINYVEAHGTATELGDPIEVTSLTKAFRTQTDRTGYCAIGSVKTNVGHLDRAAGVTGLIKIVLAMKHGVIPQSLHYQKPNPEIDFEHSPLYVNAARSKWERNGTTPRRAGINSLGMGGTNVHAVIEEAPAQEPSGPSRPWQTLVLSAKTPSALETATANLQTYLQQNEDTPLADVAFTLKMGRNRFEQRRILVCRDRQEALQAIKTGTFLQKRDQRTDRPVVFLFPGLGEQYVGMAQELYQHEATFRQSVERCCTLLKSKQGLDLQEMLFSPTTQIPAARQQERAGNEPTNTQQLDLRALAGRTSQNGQHGQASSTASMAARRLKETAVAQPDVFVIEYALAQQLLQWGIQPQAMIGYSLGEYVAACLAGVLSLEDALTLVAGRARLIGERPQGSMLAVMLSEESVQPYLANEVCLAALNAPATCVLAGPDKAIEQLETELYRQGIACRRVETTHAFHSTMLDPLREAVTDLAKRVMLHKPNIPYISGVTGTWITDEQATDPSYWAQHMCQTVRFAEGVEHLLEEKDALLLEVGTGQSLSSFVKQHPACERERMPLVFSALPSAHERQSDQCYLLTALDKLWLNGVAVDWSGFYANEHRRRVPLPAYPFERQHYWVQPRPQSARTHVVASTPEEAMQGLKREALADWFYLPGWKHSAPTQVLDVSTLLSEKLCWLLFLDNCSIGEQLRKRLLEQQQDVIVVTAGHAFSKQSESAYCIEPQTRSDYDLLLKDLHTQGKTPQRIVHLWAVTQEREEPATVLLERGFYSLLALAQALRDAELPACQITVLSNGIQDVTGNEQLCPEKATITGPCTVIPQEYPNLSCRSIDITLPEPGSKQTATLINSILEELVTDSADAMIALRGNHRWVPAFEPVKLDDREGQATQLRQQGVYLITGGLGGIGLAIAEYLAKTAQARLVLVGRTGLPAQETWPQILAAQGDSEGVGRQIRKVQEMQRHGAQVLVLKADVTDEGQMRTAVEQALATFGTLHGVFHTAGVPGVGLMQLKTAAQATSVLAPKVIGTLVLERVLHALPLDFLVLFSSITSTIGGPGQVDYCAANAFLDAYARSHSTQHGKTIAIDWCEWRWNAWEAGLAGYDVEAQQFFRESRERFGLAFDEGTEALKRILSYRLPHIVVSTQNFRSLVELSRSFTATAMLQRRQENRQSRPAHARPGLENSYVAPRNDVERQLATIWECLLGISPVGTNDNFFELGGNSLIGLDLITQIRKELKVETLAAYVLYEAPTVSAMARYLEQGKSTVQVEDWNERSEKRRESLKQRMRETRRTR